MNKNLTLLWEFFLETKLILGYVILIIYNSHYNLSSESCCHLNLKANANAKKKIIITVSYKKCLLSAVNFNFILDASNIERLWK